MVKTREEATARRPLTLAVLFVGLVLVVVDQNILIVALNTIRIELGMTTSAIAWAVEAYLVTSGGVLLIAGALGDVVGRQRVFLTGLTVFTVASAACGVATSGAVLVAGRLVQGVGAGLMLGVVLGMVAALYDDPARKDRAMRYYGVVVSVGSAAGLAVSGIVTDLVSWRALFLVNVPLGVATGVSGCFLLQRSARRSRTDVDVLGGVLVTAGLLLALFALVSGPERGWGAWPTLTSGALAAGVLAVAGVRQAREAHPLLPRWLVGSPSVRSGAGGLGLLTFGLAGLYFAGVLYLQRELGYGAATTAWAIMPVPVILMVVMPLGLTRLRQRVGALALLGFGLAAVALGLVCLIGATSYWLQVLPAIALIAVGSGVAYPRGLALSMAGTTQVDAGAASGLANSLQNLGSAMGVAVAGTVIVLGYDIALLVIAAVVAAGAGLAIAGGRRDAEGPPRPAGV